MDTGGKIRTGNILELLSRDHEVVLVGNYDPRTDADHLRDMSRFCSQFVPVQWREPKRGSIGFYLRMAKHFLSTYPITALNDYSRPLEDALLNTLGQGAFDVAICDFVQSALLFQRVTGIPTVLFQHNVEAKIFLRHLEAAEHVFARILWRTQHRRMVTYESKAVSNFDKVIAVSDNDAEIFNKEYGAKNVVSIPTGVDIDFYTPGTSSEVVRNEVVFCGSMDWLPNEDGIRYFLSDIARYLNDVVEDWRLVVVGRNPSESLRNEAEKLGNIKLTGWVDDVRPYLRKAAVCIVPLRIGGGTRMKIYEAMAMSKAVVSTTIGAEGLEVTDGINIRLVDDPKQFAQATAELIVDENKRDAIGNAARNLVVENFGWRAVAEHFANICTDVVNSAAK